MQSRTQIVVAVLVCLLLWLTGRAIARAIALISFVLGICVLSFVCGPSLGGSDNWSAVLAVATLLAVVAALFLDDIRALLHRPKIELRVEPGLVSCVLIFTDCPHEPPPQLQKTQSAFRPNAQRSDCHRLNARQQSRL